MLLKKDVDLYKNNVIVHLKLSREVSIRCYSLKFQFKFHLLRTYDESDLMLGKYIFIYL